MDEFVNRKLEEWNLHVLKEVFEENLIDEESLMLLDVDTVTELIKPIGPRMKFLAYLREFQNEQVSAHMTRTTTSDMPFEATVSSSDDEMGSSSHGPSTLSDDVSLPPSPKKTKADFNIRALLEKSAMGKGIIQEIEEGALTRKTRLAFVRIAVAHIIEKYGDRPKCEVKTRMAKAIIEEFPSLKDEEGEGFEAWYTPGKGRHSATGWLEERLRNARRSHSRRATTAKPKSSRLVVATLPESDISSDEFQCMIEWLKHNRMPVGQVSLFMEKTAVKRAQLIRESGHSGILQEYPRLFDTPGMVEQDFCTLFPDVADKLCMLWTPQYADEVLKYASLQGNWQSHLHIDSSKISDGNKTNVSLAALPCIFPSGRKGKKKASIDESLASFLDIQPIGTDIPKYLEELSNLQPYILVLGTLLKPSQVFSIVERRAISQKSLITAVDVCFKLFYILNLDYPWQSASTWEFLQKVIYGIDDEGVKNRTSPSVIAMRTALRNVSM